MMDKKIPPDRIPSVLTSLGQPLNITGIFRNGTLDSNLTGKGPRDQVVEEEIGAAPPVDIAPWIVFMALVGIVAAALIIGIIWIAYQRSQGRMLGGLPSTRSSLIMQPAGEGGDAPTFPPNIDGNALPLATTPQMPMPQMASLHPPFSLPHLPLFPFLPLGPPQVDAPLHHHLSNEGLIVGGGGVNGNMAEGSGNHIREQLQHVAQEMVMLMLEVHRLEYEILQEQTALEANPPRPEELQHSVNQMTNQLALLHQRWDILDQSLNQIQQQLGQPTGQPHMAVIFMLTPRSSHNSRLAHSPV